jgi:hypothetical protein
MNSLKRSSHASSMKDLLVALLLFIWSAIDIRATDVGRQLYVSPGGSDTNPGSFEAPWRTIQKAASVAQAGDAINIRAGIYRETVVPSNSGSPGNPIKFRGYKDEIAIISGCETADGGWTPYRGRIYQKTISLPVNGYNDHIQSNTTLLANQIFVKGKAMVLARWPNLSDPADWLNYRDNRWDQAMITNAGGKDINLVDTKLPGGLVGATVWFGGWFINRTGKVVASAPGSLTLRVHERTGTELQAFGETDPKSWSSFRRYYHVSDRLSLLDAETEWFYDGSTLFLWAPGGKSPTGVEHKQRNYAFDLRGKSQIVIEGLGIFASTIITDASSRGITLDGLNARYVSHYVTTDDNLLPHLRESGILLNGPGSVIQNSIIKYSAGNGIYLGAAGNMASNNIISDIDYVGTYECGIFPAAHPVTITHSTIRRTGRCSISGFKNDLISYNDLHHYGMLNCDLGAIYCAENVDCAGGMVDHNFIHDPASWWGNHGLYTDNSSGNLLIHHNVFWGDTMESNIFRHIGNLPNRVYNNTCVNGIFYLLETTGNDDVRNNLFVSFNGEASSDNRYSKDKGNHNLYRGTDFKFVNASAHNYRLQASSPAVDGGTTVPPYTDGYQGPAPDIGAFEYAGPDWTAGASIHDR